MKKVFMIISILTITVTLSACGGSGKQKEPSKESQKSDKYDYVYYEILNDGDSVTVIRDLKVKGSSSSIKIGTKVKNIRLIYDSSDGHDIECKIDGFGAMKLKSSVVKKA